MGGMGSVGLCDGAENVIEVGSKNDLTVRAAQTHAFIAAYNLVGVQTSFSARALRYAVTPPMTRNTTSYRMLRASQLGDESSGIQPC